jgi:hypothetical protein
MNYTNNDTHIAILLNCKYNTKQKNYDRKKIPTYRIYSFCWICYSKHTFLWLRTERSGAYSFWPFCLFVCLCAKTLTLTISFEWSVIEISCVWSLWQDLSIRTIIFYLEVWPTFQNFNIGHILLMVSDRAFMFHIHVCVPYDKNFLLVSWFLTSWPWRLNHFLKTLTLAICFE